MTRLSLVDSETGEITEGPSYGDLAHKVRDLEDQRSGFIATIEKQARLIGSLERKVREDEDPNHHPKGKEIVALIDRWKVATGHPKSKTSADRVKVIKARLADGYTLEQIELAIDGIGVFPFVAHGQRVREGTPAQRHDRLGIALAGGEKVEEFARLGYVARQKGWVTWQEE